MAAPVTIGATGYFEATRAGAVVGEATLRMKNATKGTLSLAGQRWNLKGDPAAKTFRGTGSGSVVELTIVKRGLLTGTVDGDTLRIQLQSGAAGPQLRVQGDTITGVISGEPVTARRVR